MVMNLDDGSNLNVNETAMTDWTKFDGHFQLRQFQSCISYSLLPCHCTTLPIILSSMSTSLPVMLFPYHLNFIVKITKKY